MRKLYTVILAAAFFVASMFWTAEAGENAKLSGKKLVVGTMANHLGLPVHVAEMNGYFKDAGLDVEVLIFATGAPINEAMAAEQLDVAVSGLATVHALATGRYNYIGDGVITTKGDGIFARKDSVYAKTKGPKEGVLGSADTVRGARILGPIATCAHFHVLKYTELLGLTPDDFTMVSMDYAQAMQAFISGQGDMVAATPPYSNQLTAAGYVDVADLGLGLGIVVVDANYAQKKVMEERRADVVAFMDCYYRASEELKNDPEMRRRVAMKWYNDEGKTVNDEVMDIEMSQKLYHTLDTLDSDEYPLGAFMVSIGEFFADQGMIPEERVPNIAASIDHSVAGELKAKRE